MAAITFANWANTFASLETGAKTARTWSTHEHLADSVSLEAQRLVNMAGSVELAKQAVDAAVEATPGGEHGPLADELGYPSSAEMLKATITVVAADGCQWRVTLDRRGRWVAWSERHAGVRRYYPAKDDAVEHLQTGRSPKPR